VVVHSNVNIHLFVVGTRLSATVARKSRITLSHCHPIIHHNPSKTMRTNFFLNNNILANSPRRNEEIGHILHNIGKSRTRSMLFSSTMNGPPSFSTACTLPL
ncbi:hypothetical protein K443DRAFT_625035, partial [Laccaria amethystina LaAM-08-1]